MYYSCASAASGIKKAADKVGHRNICRRNWPSGLYCGRSVPCVGIDVFFSYCVVGFFASNAVAAVNRICC